MVFLKQQDDGRTGEFKMTFLITFIKPSIFVCVKYPAYHQCPYLALYHRAEVFRCQKAPATLVQHKHRILIAGNGLNAVKNSGNKMIFALIAVINIAVVVTIGYAEPKDQTGAAL